MRRVFFKFFGLVVLCAATGVAGYYSHKIRLDPVYSLAERAELKMRREFGFKTDTGIIGVQFGRQLQTIDGQV